MNIILTNSGTYKNWMSLDEHLGVSSEKYIVEYTASPTYYCVNDKKKFFLAIITYGIEYKEISDDDMKIRKQEYLQEISRRHRMLSGRR